MRKERVKLRSLGEKIQELRKKDDLTQQAFADKIGVSIDAAKNWEQGYNYPAIDMIVKIANYFECDFDFLLGQQDTPNKIYKHFSEETQLSQDAVESLMFPDRYGNHYGKLLSALLKNQELLSQILLCCKTDYSQIPFFEDHFVLTSGINKHSVCRPDYIKRSNEMELYNCMCKFIEEQRIINHL